MSLVFSLTHPCFRFHPPENSPSISPDLNLIFEEVFSGRPIKEFKNEMTELIQKSDAATVREFLEKIFCHAIEKNDFTSTMNFLADILDDALLKRLAAENYQNKNFDEIAWAKECAPFYPDIKTSTFIDGIKTEWKKYRPTVIYFIPHLIDTCLGVFDFLDTRKKYTSLWEKSLLIGVVCNLILIPYVIVKTLTPILIVSSKVYSVAGAIIFGVGLILFSYRRWWRPDPEEVVNCKNLDQIVKNKIVGVKVGQTEDLYQLQSLLLRKEKVLIIGKSGDGKTSLVHHLIQLRHAQQLPPALQSLVPFELDCKLMTSTAKFGHAEMINQTKEQIDSFKNLVFLENLHELAGTDAFSTFVKEFVDDPNVLFIATTTEVGYQSIKGSDVGQEFRRRVKRLRLNGKDELQIKLTLNELIQRTANGIEVTQEAINRVVQHAEGDNYLKEVGCPAKAITILSEALAKCHQSLSPYYRNKIICELEQKMELSKAGLVQEMTPKSLEAHQKLLRDHQRLLHELEQENKIFQRIRSILDQQLQFMSGYHKLTHRLAQSQHVGLKEKKLFLISDLFGNRAFKMVLDKVQKLAIGKRDLKVDVELVDRVFQELSQDGE